MPKAFDTWQVHPHRPLEKLEANLWRVEGDLPGSRGTRVMTIARMRDGGLVIHNGIALEDDLMAEIEAFGKPAVLVVPNGFHRLDSKIYKQRYPSLKVLCPAGARKKVEQVVSVDGTYADAPKDDDVSLSYIDGIKEMEGVLQVKSGDQTSLIFNDMVFNVPKVGGFVGFFVGPTGQPAIPRFARWMLIKSKPAVRAHLEKLAAAPNLKRVIMSHGRPLTDKPGEVLRSLAATL